MQQAASAPSGDFRLRFQRPTRFPYGKRATPRRAASHDLIFKIEKSASAKPKGRSIKLGSNTRQGGHTASQRGRGRESAVWADWMNPQSCWAANPIEVATITKLKLKPHATWLHGATGQREEGEGQAKGRDSLRCTRALNTFKRPTTAPASSTTTTTSSHCAAKLK